MRRATCKGILAVFLGFCTAFTGLPVWGAEGAGLTSAAVSAYADEIPEEAVIEEESSEELSLAGAAGFSDVISGKYYTEAVAWAVGRGITSGTSKTRFSPNDGCTRAQTVTFLYRYAGSPKKVWESDFADVGRGKYYALPVDWAVMKSVTKGLSENLFGPDDKCTRAQIVSFLWRFCGSPEPEGSSGFSDVPDGKYYSQAVAWAVEKGITSGTSPTTFSPGDTCTRGQIVTFLHRLYEDQSRGEKRKITFDLIFPEAFKDADRFEDTLEVTVGAPAGPLPQPEPLFGSFDWWYRDAEFYEPFDPSDLVEGDLVLFGKWDFDSAGDSDGDGLPNDLEALLGTDPENEDSDGDGLSDFQEYRMGFDFLNKDTDGNGTPDGEKDSDGDGVKNIDEVQAGSDPLLADTDADGLRDDEEIGVYHTSPSLPDTDEDSIADGGEVVSGSDPLSYDGPSLTTAAPEPTEEEPVTAGVTAQLYYGDDGVLLEPVSVSAAGEEEFAYGEAIPGYLGSAYSFESDSEVEKAEISFRYDTSLGTLGEDFQPRIYYVNRKTGALEMLEGQTVSEGLVTAETDHFSTYVLLNSVAYEAIWADALKPELLDENGLPKAPVDMVFVLDISGSMGGNDPDGKAPRTIAGLASLLRSGKDRAALVTFTDEAHSYGFLDDPSGMESILYGIENFGGTDGSTGINAALNLLEDSQADLKYIVFVTDGEDEDITYPYEDLYERANRNNVHILSVGIGEASEEVLRQMAEVTGGSFYYSTVSASEDARYFDDLYLEIEGDLFDTATDSNKDGIPDYYSQLIYEGKLHTGSGTREFAGVDFNYDKDGNPSNDYDHDGVINGNEIKVVRSGNRVFLKKYSDPMMAHSDMDGLSDKEEYNLGTDPMVTEFPSVWTDAVEAADYRYFRVASDLYDQDYIFRAQQLLFGYMLADGLYETAKKQLIDYFYQYGDDRYYESLTARKAAMIEYELINTKIGQVTKYIGKVLSVAGTADDMYGESRAEILAEASGDIAELKKILSGINELAALDDDQLSTRILENNEMVIWFQKCDELVEKDPEAAAYLKDPVVMKVDKISEKYNQLLGKKVVSDLSVKDTIKLVKLGKNIGEQILTLAKINAATAAFEDNLDILTYIYQKGNHAEVRSAAAAVICAVGESTGEFLEEVWAIILRETGETIFEMVKDKVLEENPVKKGYEAAKKILTLSGADKRVKNVYTCIVYSDMVDAVTVLAENKTTRRNTGRSDDYGCVVYEKGRSDGSVFRRYLTHITQIKLLGNAAYIKLGKEQWFDALRREHDFEGEDDAKGQMKSDISFAEKLNLPLSKRLRTELGM